MGRCEIDNHADTCCLGANFLPLYFTGEMCDVAPYSDEYEPIKDIPICTAATAYRNQDTGATIILIVHQALWFGNKMAHSLINPNQIRSNGYSLSDDPFDTGRDLGIEFGTDETLPFEVDGSIVYFESYTPTNEELMEFRQLELTSESSWNPARMNEMIPKRISMVNRCGERETDLSCFDSLLSNTSDAYSDSKLVDRLVSSVRIHSNIAAKETTNRRPAIEPGVLMRRWNVGIETATKTIRATTQRGIRHAAHPLTRRYRTDLLSHRFRRLNDVWYSDTAFSTVKSLRGNTCSQVFTNTKAIIAVPMERKSGAGDALVTLCNEVGVPNTLIFDNSQEQCGTNTKFMSTIRKQDINWRATEPYSPWQNRAEDAIRELKRRMKLRKARNQVPPRVWDYMMQYECDILARTVQAGDNRTPYEMITGETPDISEYVDFEFYDWVWFWDVPGDTTNPKIGRWLGVSHRVGSAMCYYILKSNGNVVSRTTVQRIPEIDRDKDDIKAKMSTFTEEVTESMRAENFVIPETAENAFYLHDKDGDDDVPIEPHTPNAEEIDYTPDTMDPYVGAEVRLPHGDGYMTAKVLKRARGTDGNPIGRSHSNPILDTRLYDVERADGTRQEIQANVISENLFSQADSEGRQYVLLDEIVSHKSDGTAIQKGDEFIQIPNREPRRKITTRGWKLLVQWKDGSSDWVPLSELKESYPVKLAEYAVAAKISDEPAFAWWIGTVLRKRNRTIAKVKSRYWKTTHKFGIRLPHSVEEAYEIDRITGTDHWRKAIEKEMSKIRGMGTFELWPNASPDDLRSGRAKLPGFRELGVHMVFDVKMDGKFTRKARLVANGNETAPTKDLTYSSVVSRESVRIAFLYAALNGLDVLGCDVSNAYLNAPCREKLWIEAGPEFGDDKGGTFIIKRALYGLRSSGASWRKMLMEAMVNMGFTNTLADQDVWRKKATTPDGFEYYELVLIYVDDILCVSHVPKVTMDKLAGLYDLKDTVKPPDRYLGANIGRWTLPDGRDVWSMSGKDYVKNSVRIVKEMLSKDGKGLPGGRAAKRPMANKYRPEVDVSPELNAELTSRYQQLIGMLRWAVELGRIDIHLEVSLLSSHLCMPRQGHLDAVYNIFGYLDKHIESTLVLDDKEPVIDESVFDQVDWSDTPYEREEELPPNMPEPRGHAVTISAFVDADHAGNLVTWKSHTGIIIYVNNAPITWFSKRQTTVESSTFGSEFVAMRICIDMIESLRYKLRMFGIPLRGPANVFCDNGGVVSNASRPESTLNKKHNAICYHRVREAAAKGIVRIAKEDTITNTADLLTKNLATERRRELLLQIFIKGGSAVPDEGKAGNNPS